MTRALMLDTGALIAIDRGDRRMLALLEEARDARVSLTTTAPAVAQAWRGGRRQARLAAFLKQPVLDVVPFAKTDARAVGALSALTRQADVVDVHVALVAKMRALPVVTSDPDDISRIDPRLEVIAI